MINTDRKILIELSKTVCQEIETSDDNTLEYEINLFLKKSNEFEKFTFEIEDFEIVSIKKYKEGCTTKSKCFVTINDEFVGFANNAKEVIRLIEEDKIF